MKTDKVAIAVSTTAPFALLFVLLHLVRTNMSRDDTQAKPNHLNITAISAKDGVSTIECWQLASPFKTSAEAGASGASFAQLGRAENASYGVIPPHFDGGLHNAPRLQ